MTSADIEQFFVLAKRLMKVYEQSLAPGLVPGHREQLERNRRKLTKLFSHALSDILRQRPDFLHDNYALLHSLNIQVVR